MMCKLWIVWIQAITVKWNNILLKDLFSTEMMGQINSTRRSSIKPFIQLDLTVIIKFVIWFIRKSISLGKYLFFVWTWYTYKLATEPSNRE